MQLTAAALAAIGGPKARPAICQGIVDNLAWLDKFGIAAPLRLCHFLAQCGEESDHFHTLREYATGAAYEGRKDLGNVRAGDGVRFAGAGLIEVTGRANYRAFTVWIRKIVADAPDFEAAPALLQQFPWALYSAVWYWASHDLNRLADDNNILAITHKVNGGTNGFGERVAMFVRSALVCLGYGPLDLKRFQAEASLTVDGIAGNKTLAALAERLKALPAAVLAVPLVVSPEHAPPAEPLVPDAPAAIRHELPAAPAPAAIAMALSTEPYQAPSFTTLFLRWLASLFGVA